MQNDEFVSAVMQATSVAVRNHRREKIDALRHAVLNSALGKSPGDIKSAMFVALVDQFTVWHLQVLLMLSQLQATKGQNELPKARISQITEVVLRKIPELNTQKALTEIVVEDLCRKGLLYWVEGPTTAYTPQETSQITDLGKEFLQYISSP